MAGARKQEQESAREEVTEVAPGVLRMELPIRMPGLGHVNCYALLDERGAALVDPGMPGSANWKALQQRLAGAGLRVRDVHTVVITHSHPDHFGGATRIAKESGARIVGHQSFRFGVAEAVREKPEVSVDDLAAQAERPAAEPSEAPARRGAKRHTPPWKAGLTPWGGEPPRPSFKMRMRWRLARALGRLAFVPQISD